MKVMVLAGFQLDGGETVGRGDVIEVPDAQVPALVYANRVVPYGSAEEPRTREAAPQAQTTADVPAVVKTTKGRGRRGS